MKYDDAIKELNEMYPTISHLKQEDSKKDATLNSKQTGKVNSTKANSSYEGKTTVRT